MHAANPTLARRRASNALSSSIAGSFATRLRSELNLQVHLCQVRGRAARPSGRTVLRSQATAALIAVLLDTCVMQCIVRASAAAKHKDDDAGWSSLDLHSYCHACGVDECQLDELSMQVVHYTRHGVATHTSKLTLHHIQEKANTCQCPLDPRMLRL